MPNVGIPDYSVLVGKSLKMSFTDGEVWEGYVETITHYIKHGFLLRVRFKNGVKGRFSHSQVSSHNPGFFAGMLPIYSERYNWDGQVPGTVNELSSQLLEIPSSEGTQMASEKNA